jgi:hypothetical protein
MGSSKPMLLAPLAAQAAAGYSTRSGGSRSSKNRKQAEEAMTEAAVQQLKSMLHVRGIGKSYEKLLRDQGIKTVEALSGEIISRLEAKADHNTTWTPAVEYLLVSVPPAASQPAGQQVLLAAPSNSELYCCYCLAHVAAGTFDLVLRGFAVGL